MSLVPLVYQIEVASDYYSVLNKLIPLSSHVWSITPVEFWWDDIYSLALLSSIFFSIDTSNWLCISFFLQSNKFVWWNFGKNVDTRKVLISYNIITVVCILTIWFPTIDMWGKGNTSPPLTNLQNLPSFFPSWKSKRVMNCLSRILMKLEYW